MTNIIRSYRATLVHKFWVARYLIPFALRLIVRALVHDLSKLSPSEAPAFGRLAANAAKVEYGSEEYRARVEAERPAVSAHARRNSHHPEYHVNGYFDMSALDRVEMMADWIAASRRYKQRGNFYDSLAISQQRYGLSESDVDFLFQIAWEMLRGRERA